MSVVDRTSSEFSAWLDLYERASLLELGRLADAERRDVSQLVVAGEASYARGLAMLRALAVHEPGARLASETALAYVTARRG
jgi:hypothetical protein